MCFSILVANYNNAAYLAEAINSVFSQTYKDWELIIVDDGSTDDSNSIYKKYANHERIKIFYNSTNQGVAYTKHRCLELANGKYCGFLDPDDVLAENALEKVVEQLENHPQLSLVYSNFFLCNSDLSECFPYQYQQGIPKEEVLLVGLTPNHFTAFPKQKYQQTSGIDLRLKKAIDRDLVLKLEEQGEVAHIEDYLYYYRINDNSISNNQHAYKAEYWAWECRYAACERRGRAKDEIYDTVLRYRNAGNEQYFDAKTTIDYKLGNMILAPLRWLKYKLKFNRMKN